MNDMRRVAMALIILTVAVVFANGAEAVKTGWFAEEEAVEKNPFTSDPNAATEGKKIYSKHCAKCHGADGKGGGASSESMQIELPDFTDGATTGRMPDGGLFWKIRSGQFEMPPFQVVLKDDEIWKVVTYIRTLAK